MNWGRGGPPLEPPLDYVDVECLFVYFRRLLEVQTPDEFYTAMGSLSLEMLDGTVVDEDALIQVIHVL